VPLVSTAETIQVGQEEPTYRPDGPHAFFRDLAMAHVNPVAAAASVDRLMRHQRETGGPDPRADVTTADPGAVGFIPPNYMADLWAALPRESRPFANAVASAALPPSGMTLSIPKVQSGTTVAVQAAENDAVSETDIDTQTVTVNIRTIAGQNDISMQALERSFPGMDTIIMRDLTADYDEQLDTQLLAGAGTGGTHLGIRAVTGRNTVTYTAGTPTGIGLLPKIYDGIQQIASGLFRQPTLIVMHPRRAAWLAKEQVGTNGPPILQQGGLFQQFGEQGGGFAGNIAGLRVVIDANVATGYGASTNEDEVYIVRSDELILMEGPLRARVLSEVLAGTLQVRIQVYAYSAFISARQPEAIAHISGTGLVVPTF
jgi:HK97 family phage major capsid protein